MANCAITVTFKDASGAVVPNLKVTFTPVSPDKLRAQDGAVILGAPIEVTADAGGVAAFTLKTGSYVYETLTRLGPVKGTFAVPDRATALLDAILSTPEVPYEIMTWSAFQALVAATNTPYASVAAGLAAVAEGAYFLALSDDKIAAARKVSGAVTFVYPEIV